MRKFRGLLFFLFSVTFICPLLASGDEKGLTLDDILRIGMDNNPLLAAQQSDVRAKEAAYKAAKRLFNPELEFQAGRGETNDGLETINTRGLALSQAFENPLKRHFGILIYENDWQASESYSDYIKLELTYKIKTVFYQILLYENLLELAEKNLESISEIQRLIEKRALLGEVKQLEAIKLQVETLKARNEQNRIRTERSLAREKLNALLNNSLPQDFSVSGGLEYSPLSEKIESYTAQTRLLPYPLLKMKDFEIQKAQSSLSRIKWQRLPDFRLSGFSNQELDGINSGIGIALDIPIWNIQSKEIAEAENLLKKIKNERQALLMDLTTEVKAKLGKLRLSEETIKLFLTGLIRQAEESLKISEASYRQGEISLIDFLDSQRTHYSIMTDYQNSLYAWNVDKAALEKAIGEDIQ